MGGEVVLVRCLQHLAGARCFIVGMILPQLRGNRGMRRDRFLGRGEVGGFSLRLETKMVNAAKAVGKRLRIELV